MDVLTLSQRNLQELSNLDQLSADQISKLCRLFLQSLLLGTNKPIDEKWIVLYKALGALLLEAARTNSNEAQVRTILQELTIQNESIEAIISFYISQKDTLITYLNRFGISFPRIVGMKWRLDYSIRSKTLGKENIPMFHIALEVMANEHTINHNSNNNNHKHMHSNTNTNSSNTNGNNEISEITFLATLEELQDFLAKVKDGIKQVDRVLKMES